MKKISLSVAAAAMMLSVGCTAQQPAIPEETKQETSVSQEAESSVQTVIESVQEKAPQFVKDAKTMKDILYNISDEYQSAIYDGMAVFVFKDGDDYYRAEAGLTKEQSELLLKNDFTDSEALHAVLDDVEITELKNINCLALGDEDIKNLIGKTGKDLLENGWSEGSGWNLDDKIFWLSYGPFEYKVEFNGDIANPDDFEFEDGISELMVQGIELSGLSNSAADPDESLSNSQSDT